MERIIHTKQGITAKTSVQLLEYMANHYILLDHGASSEHVQAVKV